MPQARRSNNRLLSVLPEGEWQELTGKLERVRVPAGTVICQSGEPLPHVYFPLSSVLSAMVVLEDGTAVEVATIGSEGMVGVELLVGDSVCRHRIVQHLEGETLRIRTVAFRQVTERSAKLRELMQHYALARLQQANQTLACNLRHTVEQRLCRWLAGLVERAGTHEFSITQETLSEILGVRRQSVSLAAGQLQQTELIAYRRGRLKIVNQHGLERCACECYRVNREAYQRAMQGLAV